MGDRHSGSEENIIEDDEMNEHNVEPLAGPSQPAAAAVQTPGRPQMQGRVLDAGADTMAMQTPAAISAGDQDMEMPEANISPGMSAQRQFLASVLKGADMGRRQACITACLIQVPVRIWHWTLR